MKHNINRSHNKTPICKTTDLNEQDNSSVSQTAAFGTSVTCIWCMEH